MADTLIAQLEAATKGSPQLNAKVWWGADPSKAWISYCNAATGKPGPRPDKMLSSGLGAFGMCSQAPAFTTSLDAKLPWENIVDVTVHDGIWKAHHVDPKTGRSETGIGHTEPLARRCAALKARAKVMEAEGKQ